MKRLLLLTLFATTVLLLHAQIEEGFIPAPLGWVIAQGAQFTNGIILTPGVGGFNPANIGTPPVYKTSDKMKVCFDIWATDAYGQGTNKEPFPCTTYADILFVKSTVKDSRDAELAENIYARQDNYILPKNGGTTCFTFTFPAIVAASDFKVFISFHADCIQGGFKYIFDNLCISGVGLICGGTNCAPVALNDVINRGDINELSFNGILYGSNNSFPPVPTGYAVDATGIDNDANDDYSDLQWSLLTPPVNGSVVVNNDGSVAVWRNSTAVTQLTFTYRLMDDGPDNDFTTLADNMYNDATVTVNWPVGSNLPVSLIKFNAERSGSTVNLQWTTAAESNNIGFKIQRSTGDGVWQNSGYVASKAFDGTSNTPISYQYNETNTAAGFTWYRLVQKDKDNTSTISASAGVRGMEESARVSIYPNPGTSGNMNVLFGNSATHDISVMDLSGRIVRTWKNYHSDKLLIDGIKAGVYMLVITTRLNNEKQVYKIVIK
ncbi:T9SS type A sorting domain-containing protein [Niastella sp. OAS944]|uniref:T9SS type A sorting domain-containing protein n=1 Tax=Niastella sp. OAS944 TaxID=2664089 RepID=UPI0034823C3B|nr:hypothetical protein [Chitinophagaceae bacterium OAS944]